MAKSELDGIIDEIKKNAKQISINKVDEVKVMKSMLNDKNFKIPIYDKNEGYIGDKCPAEEAHAFVAGVIQSATGLDSKDSKHLAENYEFTKKDAIFMISNAKDFIEVYTRTGRKLNIIQNGATETSIYARDVDATIRTIPAKPGSSELKKVSTPAYTKIVAISKAPKYIR